jgi:hypothetical protein
MPHTWSRRVRLKGDHEKHVAPQEYPDEGIAEAHGREHYTGQETSQHPRQGGRIRAEEGCGVERKVRVEY